MKSNSHPKATAKALRSNRHYSLPSVSHRVEIDFLPQSDWTIEVGISRPVIQSHRNYHTTVARSTVLAIGFAPIELLVAAALDERRRHNRIVLNAHFTKQL